MCCVPPVATIIDYLDRHAGAFTALLTLALIVVTIFYAWQNWRMVCEMKKSRDAAITPKLGLEFLRLGPTAMTVAIRNVGPGAAFAIDVRLVYDPIAEGDPTDEQPWRYNMLTSGEQRDLIPPGDLNDNLNRLPRTYKRIRLVGSMRDADGRRHGVDEEISNLDVWREVLEKARQRWVDANAERRLADELAKKLRGPLDGIAGQIGSVSVAITELREHPPDEHSAS
jgi:hypothetical protein